MGSLKANLTACITAFALSNPAFAFPISPSERARIFADCAGRYSALAMHQRYFDGAASEISQARSQAFVDLLEAVFENAVAYGVDAAMPMNWRVEAKMGQMALLQRATFHTDKRLAEKSGVSVRQYLAQCDELIFAS